MKMVLTILKNLFSISKKSDVKKYYHAKHASRGGKQIES